MLTALPGAALAQAAAGGSGAEDPYSVVDQNGVNLITGKPSLSTRDLTIGDVGAGPRASCWSDGGWNDRRGEGEAAAQRLRHLGPARPPHRPPAATGRHRRGQGDDTEAHDDEEERAQVRRTRADGQPEATTPPARCRIGTTDRSLPTGGNQPGPVR